jgi:predicted ATP-dependent protease
MTDARDLTAKELVNRCEPAELGFELTSELPLRSAGMGQDRALEAIEFGIDIKQLGFNLFVLGPTGSGRRKLTRTLIEQRAIEEPVPSDFCYVHNFEQPRQPKALRLPAGQGARLRDQMEHLIADLPGAISAAFDNQTYRERHDAIEQDVEQRHEHEMNAIAERAAIRGLGVLQTPGGMVIAPMRDGKVLEPEERAKLNAEEQSRLEQGAQEVHDELHEALRRVPQLQREQRQRIRELDQDITRAVIRELLADIRRAFGELPQVLEQLELVERDIVGATAELIRAPQQSDGPLPVLYEGLGARDGLLRRYRVNLLVDHRTTSGAPVVVVDHPSSANLVGKVEHLSQFGVLVTDFNLIKAGALHAANGGYLILDARRILTQPVSWEQLKRTLRSGEIRIESVAEALDLSAGVSQEPEPIPFRGKVVLIGEPWLYHRLCAFDPEFEELFKVVADFETDIQRTPEACRAYAELLGRFVQQEQLRPLHVGAVARLIDRASRMCDHATRLSMHVRAVFDLVREAEHLAGRAGRDRVLAEDVERAVALRERRHGRLRERIQTAIAEGTIHVLTSGACVGQINGLSVAMLGEGSFGFPTRITARARLGSGEVVDVEREVDLGGPIHSKGVLILSAFLGGRYRADKPLSLRGTLVFEQTYGQVEGDSASLAELLALLSAVGELPIVQGIAVTGSVDQHGRVQAVGGVSDKVEGFFEVCSARGLDGSHGVIIPSANVRHLMLRPDVVSAAENGKFHVWGVDDVDQAMTIAFGLPAGERGADGLFGQGTANERIDAGLDRLRSAALEAAKAVRAPQQATSK